MLDWRAPMPATPDPISDQCMPDLIPRDSLWLCPQMGGAQVTRVRSTAPSIYPDGNRCGCTWWLIPKCPARGCPWQGKRPVDRIQIGPTDI
jgi:hypothetical protein